MVILRIGSIGVGNWIIDYFEFYMKLGFAFGESVEKKTRRSGRIGGIAEVFGDEALVGRVETDLDALNDSISSWRLLVFSLLLVLSFALLFARIVKLSIIENERNLALSDGNRVMTKTIHAERGVIYDRNGKVLVRNVPAFRLFNQAKCSENENHRWGEPKEYCSGYKLISRDEALAITAKGDSASERLEVDSLRQYIYKDVLAHVLGYTGELSEEEISQKKNYNLGDRVGRTGIEEQYEDILRGKDGKELYEVDALGSVLRPLGRQEPVNGNSVNLSIDIDIQNRAFESLGNYKGVVIVSRPANGEILAMVSKPSFDPNIFTMGTGDPAGFFGDQKNLPLINRAISGTYPPGSTFKLIVASGALEEGKINEKTIVDDNGVIDLNGYKFPNWYFLQYGKTEGPINVVRAITRSNDIFFYKTAGELGNDLLVRWEKNFGLGAQTGIDLPSESKGLVPDNEWKQKNIGDKWYLGDTYHLGIGQGYLLTTPIQVLNWTNIIANSGQLVKLHLAGAVEKPQKIISPENAKLIRDGMVGACSDGGTGYPLFGFKVKGEEIPIACKTGTAEYGGPKDKPHAWFTMFAPSDNPEISITVLVEGGGEGSVVAAPIAKKVLEGYYGM